MKRNKIIEVLEKYNLLIDEGTGQCAISDIDFDKIADELSEEPQESKEQLLNKYWQCPHCQYKMTDLEFMSIKYNFGCPKCETSFEKFKSITDYSDETILK